MATWCAPVFLLPIFSLVFHHEYFQSIIFRHNSVWCVHDARHRPRWKIFVSCLVSCPSCVRVCVRVWVCVDRFAAVICQNRLNNTQRFSHESNWQKGKWKAARWRRRRNKKKQIIKANLWSNLRLISCNYQIYSATISATKDHHNNDVLTLKSWRLSTTSRALVHAPTITSPSPSDETTKS